MEYLLIDRTNKKFYQIMGPYLSRRDIVAETGYTIWDDEDKHWCVAMNDGQVAGFCAVRLTKKAWILSSAYTIPAMRRKGVYRQLHKLRMGFIRDADETATPRKVTVTASASTADFLTREGFKPVRNKGKFTVLELSL